MLGLATQAGSQEISAFVVPPDAEPVFSVGVRDGEFPYELYNVAGAARFTDGSVVVVVGGYHEVRKFGPDGQHQWTFGRRGEGPREFQLPQLPQGCATDEDIVVYDRTNRRATVLDLNGRMTASYRLVFEGRQPYRMSCAPSGQVVMLGWGRPEHRPSRPGPYRWTSNLGFVNGEGSDVTMLRMAIPGADRFMYFRDGVPYTEGPQT